MFKVIDHPLGKKIQKMDQKRFLFKLTLLLSSSAKSCNICMPSLKIMETKIGLNRCPYCGVFTSNSLIKASDW